MLIYACPFAFLFVRVEAPIFLSSAEMSRPKDLWALCFLTKDLVRSPIPSNTLRTDLPRLLVFSSASSGMVFFKLLLKPLLQVLRETALFADLLETLDLWEACAVRY